jgi:hypothetical protein
MGILGSLEFEGTKILKVKNKDIKNEKEKDLKNKKENSKTGK